MTLSFIKFAIQRNKEQEIMSKRTLYVYIIYEDSGRKGIVIHS